LFEGYNAVYRERLDKTRVEVKCLFGPLEATRTNVLRELLVRPYDVLHFAGHCVYRWGGDPTLSGWVFNAKEKEVLSANELNRIDRIPKFVFSNACESGITPDRSGERSAQLAPPSPKPSSRAASATSSARLGPWTTSPRASSPSRLTVCGTHTATESGWLGERRCATMRAHARRALRLARAHCITHLVLLSTLRQSLFQLLQSLTV
jgi:hypothetical protein